VVKSHRLLDAHLRCEGAGQLHWLCDEPEAAVRSQAKDGYHQAGTTRMSSRPEDGVVDAELRVHGTRNLYVASSSVFPSSGQANSTFLAVALTLRLADHLRTGT
jgi:choline dehydrogenase-like flavoprotein